MAYPPNSNNRVFYATQGVAIGDKDATAVVDSWTPASGASYNGAGNVIIMHGLQSIGVSTNFNLEQIFELGQLSLYENYEEIPEIEVSFEKLLDGYTLVYHAGTPTAKNATLTGRAAPRSDIRMVIGYDTSDEIVAGGTNSGVAELYCSGTYISSVSYNLGTDGSFTESTTFVGNDKQWLTESDTGGLLTDTDGAITAAFNSTVFGNDAPVGVANSVLRRQNVVTGSTGKTLGGGTFRTVIPSFIEGGSYGATGVQGSTAGTGLSTNTTYIDETTGPYLQSASVSVDLGRENISQLGKKAPYYRYVSFPVDVTCDIEVVAKGGDNVDAYEEGYPTAGTGQNAGVPVGKNLADHSIQFVLDDSTVLQLGNKNKLTSVSYGGGDAGGGNATISYSFTNSNDFVVLHSGDPVNISTTNYWKDYFS
tara:strand:+ start:2500 stop:3765 length:1266 start_codon:yes stop_codon:yes gene_type:complete